MRVIELPKGFTVTVEDIGKNLEQHLEGVIESFIRAKSIAFELTEIFIQNDNASILSTITIRGKLNTNLSVDRNGIGVYIAKRNFPIELIITLCDTYLTFGYLWDKGEPMYLGESRALDFAVGNEQCEVHSNGKTYYNVVNPLKWKDGTILRVMYIFYNYLKVISEKLNTLSTEDRKKMLTGDYTMSTWVSLGADMIYDIPNNLELQKKLINLTPAIRKV